MPARCLVAISLLLFLLGEAKSEVSSDRYAEWEKEILSELQDGKSCGGRVCSPFADCVSHHVGHVPTYKCTCRGGFHGDGHVCEGMCAAGVAQRVDCFQNGEPDKDQCHERGCCWNPYVPKGRADTSVFRASRRGVKKVRGRGAVPACFFPTPANSYVLKDVVESKHGFAGTLECSGKNRHGDGSGGNGQPPHNIGVFGSEVCPLKLVVMFEDTERVRVRITDPTTARWEVPQSLFARKVKAGTDSTGTVTKKPLYRVTYTIEPFGIAIARASTGHVVLNTTQVQGLINGLSFEQQFWQFSSEVEEDPLLFGLGQQKAPMKLPAGEAEGLDVYTLWARDPGGTPGHNAKGGSSLYGSHPFVMQVSKETGTAHGLLVRSSNAMDAVLAQRSLTFRGTGGIIDFTIFMGPTQKHVVSQYTKLIGRPHMPPSWALGFHMCRWGYGSVKATRAVVERMRLEGVPQDSQWNDIDYMESYRDFTLDSKTFAESDMKDFVEDLHKHKQKYVMIVDAAIAADVTSSYPPLEQGLEMDVFIKTEKGSASRGIVWPGYVHFPDFFHPNASAYWLLQLEKWHEVVDYDGVWLDMNEPSNFCDGECPPDCAKEHMFECKAVRGPEQERTRMLYAPWRLRQHGGRAFDPSHPPYIPGGAPSLDIKTVSMTARQCVQEPPIPYTSSCISALHYDTHNLYGISEARVTSGALEKILKRRSLIISRSTFPGSGKYGGAWLGDSDASWEDMRLSISGILTMGMLGIPLVGADICGFAGNTTRELCIRWSQLGSMYPFSRNHNDLKSISQEPYAFDQEALDIIKGALLTRYRLFPYMYTLFGEAHATGVPVARSLLMEFPGMVEIAAHVEDQFLLGHALMVSPVLSAGAIAVNMYLPPARWYDFYTGAELMGSPGWVHIVAPLSSLLLHVRGGTIIPMQQPKTTTAEVRASNFTLVAALSEDYRAIGNILLDDGETMTSDSLYKSLHITVQAAAGLEGEIGNMTTTVSGMYSPSSDPGISKDLKVTRVEFFGLGRAFPWGGNAQFALAGFLLPQECVEEKVEAAVVRVSLGIKECGKAHSILKPMLLFWWKKV